MAHEVELDQAWIELARARTKVAELLDSKLTTSLAELAEALDIALFRIETLYVERDRLVERVEALEEAERQRQEMRGK